MLDLFQPLLNPFLSNNPGTSATIRKKVGALVYFLNRGDIHLRKENIQDGQVSPVALVKLVRASTEREGGYLNPFCPGHRRQPTTLKGYIGWINQFITDLKMNSSYIAVRPDKHEGLDDCLRLLGIAKQTLKKPCALAKIKYRHISRKELTPKHFIHQLITNDYFKHADDHFKDREILSVAVATKIRNALLSFMVCHSVRRSREMMTFSLDEASTSECVLSSSHPTLTEDIYVFSLFDHKNGTKDQASVVIPKHVADLFTKYLIYARPALVKQPYECSG